MKTYEDYQPSFINGIDVIPLNWREAPIKQLVEINPESLGEKTEAELQISYIDIGNVNSYGEIEEIQQLIFKDAPSRARRIVRKGDVLVSTVRTYLKAIAAVESDEENLIASTGFAVLRADEKNVAASYLKYAVRGGYFIEAVVANSTGVSYPAISSTIFSNIKLVLPSYDEQRAIAAYLDRKTAQLDTLLAQKEALLRMLNQKRQALINEAVTQGLDPGAPRKPSGVAWLGDVPAHWEVKKLKYCVRLNSNEIEDDGGGMRVALENIESKTGKYISTETAPFEGPGNSFKTGDVLFSKLRPYLAKALLAPQDGVAVGEILVLSTLEEILNNYFLLNRVLSPSFIEVVDSSTYGSKMPRASWNFIGEMKISVPPLSEQSAIVDFIEDVTSKINEATAAIHTQIKILKAYRQSLISEVVTGKVDVRTAEAVAPEADLPLWRQ